MKRTKKLKVKWKNVGILAIGLFALSVIIHDVFMLTIYSWITGRMAGWTWFGLATFLLAFWIGGEILEYIIEESKK